MSCPIPLPAGIVERNSNLTTNETVRLRLLSYNANQMTNVLDILKVDIYYLDPAAKTEENPSGQILVQTITSDKIVNEDIGKYYTDVPLIQPRYVIGQYADVWTLQFEQSDLGPTCVTQYFEIFSHLWATSPTPLVYDFSFKMNPNKIRKGEKKYISVEVIPNVPRATDLIRYYYTIATLADINVSIYQECGACLPSSQDLRLVVDCQPVDYRNEAFGYYFLDTTDLDCGIYFVWFQMIFGEGTYISDNFPLQIY